MHLRLAGENAHSGHSVASVLLEWNSAASVGAAGRGRPPQAAPAGRLEVVEKLLTSITAGSGLAFGQATSRSSWISLGLAADMRDQGLTQLLLGELVT
jgi:hypothetical protein